MNFKKYRRELFIQRIRRYQVHRAVQIYKGKSLLYKLFIISTKTTVFWATGWESQMTYKS